MKSLTYFYLLVSVLAVALSDLKKGVLQKPFDLRVYSNNVRYDSPENKRLKGELPWESRKVGVINAIKEEYEKYPTLIGIQEALNNQLMDIVNGINENSTGWTYYGVGRDDGKTKGEYSAILYNTNVWNLVNGTYKWLSHTPDVPSKYPGAATKRIVTITTFENIQNGVKVNYLNTHLDQKSKDAREFSTELINSYIRSIPNDYPTFLSGDFNSKNTDIAYQTTAELLKDSATNAVVLQNNELHTYSNFDGPQGENIDFIWSSNSTKADYKTEILSHKIIDNLYNGTYRFSDHRPVLTHYELHY